MIHPRHATVWCPGFLGLCDGWTQGDVGFLGSDVHPSRAVAALAFAAHAKLRKCGLQETDHPLDIAYSNVRMFELNSHGIPPILVPGLMRPALWLALFVQPQEARRVVADGKRSLIRGPVRLDVLVEAQHVVWVVLFLDFDEASIVRAIGCADKLVTRFA